MRFDVIGIDELTNLPKFTGRGSLEFFDSLDHQVYIAFSTWSQHQFRPIRTDGLFALVAHALRHDDDDWIALSSTNARGGYACVAGRTLNNGLARPQVTAPFGLRDKKWQDAAFDAAAGIEIFDLGYDGRLRIAYDAAQTDHRGHACRVKNVFCNMRATIPVNHEKYLLRAYRDNRENAGEFSIRPYIFTSERSIESRVGRPTSAISSSSSLRSN